MAAPLRMTAGWGAVLLGDPAGLEHAQVAQGDRGAADPLSAGPAPTGDFAPALAEFFGSSAGLSASTVNRLTEAWQAEHEDWSGRDLSGVDYVYWWADGVHFNIRLEEDRLCCLVIVGACGSSGRHQGTGSARSTATREVHRQLGRGPALAARSRPGAPWSWRSAT